MVIITVSPQARSLTLAEGKPLMMEVFWHVCHFFLIESIGIVGLSQGIPRLVGGRDTAQPSGEGGPTRVPITNSCHDMMRCFLREPRELRGVFDAMLEIVNNLKSEVFHPEQPLPMVPFCILSHVSARTSGWRQVPTGFPLQPLKEGVLVIVTQGVTNQAS